MSSHNNDNNDSGKTCSLNPDSQTNNGLITKIWGGPMWIANHAITFGYPVKPTDDKKKDYEEYFIALGKVLPCKYCRESYQKFITTGETELTDADLESREALTKWFYRIHETVNHKLGVDYGITYEDVETRYESFRARCGMADSSTQGCITPLDYKAFSYKKLNQKDCPIIPLELVSLFARLATLRDIDLESFQFYQLAKELDGDITKLKAHETWEKRNYDCQEIIRYMRENAIPSIEPNGEWAGTPTILELKLILLLSSNLNKTELKDTICTLMQNQIYFRSIDSIID